jgi:hypothetical protein
MSVLDPNSVDAAGIDKESGDVVLTISDHLEWDDANGHLLALQAKLNGYLRFVEGGDLPEAASE